MSTNQELRQKTCRDSAGTSYNVNGDWLAIASDAGFSTGTFNERLLNYYNATLGATWGVAAWDEVAWDGADGNHTNINEAAAAFGESNGVAGPGSLFSQLGSF